MASLEVAASVEVTDAPDPLQRRPVVGGTTHAAESETIVLAARAAVLEHGSDADLIVLSNADISLEHGDIQTFTYWKRVLAAIDAMADESSVRQGSVRC
jgi:hypothetical protein